MNGRRDFGKLYQKQNTQENAVVKIASAANFVSWLLLALTCLMLGWIAWYILSGSSPLKDLLNPGVWSSILSLIFVIGKGYIFLKATAEFLFIFADIRNDSRQWKLRRMKRKAA